MRISLSRRAVILTYRSLERCFGVAIKFGFGTDCYDIDK